MTVALRKRVARAEARREGARDAVYAAVAPRTDVPFSGCLAVASDAVRAEYEAARDALADAEQAAISAGKAWRGSFSLLHWY